LDVDGQKSEGLVHPNPEGRDIPPIAKESRPYRHTRRTPVWPVSDRIEWGDKGLARDAR